jgi:hypothetical protein
LVHHQQIGVNLGHDTAEGFLGAAVPTVTWDSEEESVAGLFDVQVRKPILLNVERFS